MHVERFGATVLVNGIQLTSAVDRESEARVLANMVPEDAREAWLYGAALGDVARLLLKRPRIERLNVAIMNADLHAAIPDDRSWERDPRVTLHAPGTVEQVTMPCSVSPVEIRFAEPAAHRLRDRLQTLLHKPYNDFVQERLAVEHRKREAENARLLSVFGKVSDLFGTITGDAYVIGGGPSGPHFFGGLRDQFVIAASTALIPLLAANVFPTIVVVLDRSPLIGKHFPNNLAALRYSSLVVDSMAWPDVYRRWPGPRYVMRDGDLYQGGSVIHAAADLAVRMGASTVNLIGADFCYPGGQSHAAGVTTGYELGSRSMTAINGYGESVITDEALSMYGRGMEDLIAEYPAVSFIKHGREGLPLRGATWADDRRAA